MLTGSLVQVTQRAGPHALNARRSSLKHTLSLLVATSFMVMGAQPAYAVASAELIRNQAYVYGKFEARVRFAPGDGVVSSFFLWKSGSEVSGAYWNELDFEKLGADCRLQTNALYGAPVGDHSETKPVDGDLCGEYHTYAFEWTPTEIVWLVDEVVLRRETGEAVTAFAEHASSGMQMHFNVWPGDASFGGNFDPAILPVRQYINWVQYSSYTDTGFVLQWHEEFDGGKVPSGWSTGNWASPKGYSTHSAANVNFASSIAVLSLTSDTATGFSDTPPVDNSAGGTPSTGGASGTGGTTSASTIGETGGAAVSASNATNPTNDDGCGCRTTRAPHSTGYAASVILVLGALLARRRARVRPGS